MKIALGSPDSLGFQFQPTGGEEQLWYTSKIRPSGQHRGSGVFSPFNPAKTFKYRLSHYVDAITVLIKITETMINTCMILSVKIGGNNYINN